MRRYLIEVTRDEDERYMPPNQYTVGGSQPIWQLVTLLRNEAYGSRTEVRLLEATDVECTSRAPARDAAVAAERVAWDQVRTRNERGDGVNTYQPGHAASDVWEPIVRELHDLFGHLSASFDHPAQSLHFTEVWLRARRALWPDDTTSQSDT